MAAAQQALALVCACECKRAQTAPVATGARLDVAKGGGVPMAKLEGPAAPAGVPSMRLATDPDANFRECADRPPGGYVGFGRVW